MAYKTLDYGRDRHVIVDRESNVDEMRITPNLADDQFKIELLMVKDCPIRTSCIRIEVGVNSICNHLGSYTLAGPGKTGFSRLACQYEESKLRAVSELWVEGCPLGKNCASCEGLLGVDIPSSQRPDKSHAYITCKTRHSIGE